MEEASYVVVFPTVFAQSKMAQLAADIKKILNLKDQRYKSVERDGDVILVHANDPVFASSAIGLLFGVKRIAIARRTDNSFEELVSKIVSVGGNLLLSGERFIVKVEGTVKGFTAKDAEMAATSKIIDKTELGAVPGTDERFDKELYTYITKKNAYVCIFSDGGLWGAPHRYDSKIETFCAIYDELSAVSCFEAMRQGYDVSVMVFYKKKQELLALARLLNRLIPKLLREEVSLQFVQVTGGLPRGRGSYLAYISAITDAMLRRSGTGDRVSLAVPPDIFTPEVTDAFVVRVSEDERIPLVPLAGTGIGIYEIVRELGLTEGGIKRLEKTAGSSYGINSLIGKDNRSRSPVRMATPVNITVRVGPNNIHDILDSLAAHRRL